MTPNISFLLPTNRPQPQFSSITIQSILDCKTDYSYEILVYSKDCPQILDKKVKWIAEGDNFMGPLHAFNYLAHLSRGKYVVTIVDDHYVAPNFFSIFDFLQSATFKDRQYKICTIKSGGTCHVPHMAPFSSSPQEEALFKSWIVPRFPILDRDTLKKMGKIFDDRLKYHYGDICLGVKLAKLGEPIIEFSGTEIYEFKWACNNQHDGEEEKICVEILRELMQ